MRTATLGQHLVNETLPDDMRDYDRVLDKKGLSSLLREVAEKHPDKYREISHKLLEIGSRASQESGGMAFGVKHLGKARAAVKTRQKLTNALAKILDRDDLDDRRREELIVRAIGREIEPQQEAILKESLEEGNPLALQVLSGSRGNKMNLASLRGSDMLYVDHRGRPLPIPILRSYSEGLSPEEYWAGTYGARHGVIALKSATRDAGFLSKQLNQVAHRLVVVDEDEEEAPKVLRGMPVDTNDMDNEGALLAYDAGPYKRNTHLTPKILKHLQRMGHDRILVRSPIIGGSPEGGVYSRDVGVRERGNLPGLGEMVGLTAAQALSEPLTQAQISAKHGGGVAGEDKAVSGFERINQLVQTPRVMKGGAAHAQVDGTVGRIEKAPAGGNYVTIDGEQHYVGQGFDLKVKKGDTVEAGDVLSEGLPNPGQIVRHKGVGEGRRYFTWAFRQALQDAGLKAHRRNTELLSRGLINHVRLTEEYEDGVPGDVIPYSTLEHRYTPREDYEDVEPRRAVGQYLERPVLHYTIGTKVRPSMLREFERFGVNTLSVHKNPPPFEPEMIRGMYSMQHDPDWLVRHYGSGLKKSLLSAAQRGGTSEERGSSFVPALARSTNFGRTPNSVVRKPGPGFEPPRPSLASEQTEQRKPKPVRKSWFGGRFKLSSDAELEKIASLPAPYKKPTSTPPGTSGGVQGAAERSAQGVGPSPSAQMGTTVPSAGTGGNPYAAGAAAAGGAGGVEQVGSMPAARPQWGSYASPGMMGSPLAVPLIQQVNKMLPGVGGVMTMGTLMSPQSMRVLTSGQRYSPLSGTGGWQGAGGSGIPPAGYQIDQQQPTPEAAPEVQQPAAPAADPQAAMDQRIEQGVDNAFDTILGTKPGTGVFSDEAPTNLRDALPESVRNYTPDWAEDMFLRFMPNPANPSRELGQAAMIRQGLAPIGRGLSTLWRAPVKGTGYLPWLRNTRAGEWLRNMKFMSPKGGPGMLTRLMNRIPGASKLWGAAKGAKPGVGPLGHLAIALDAIGTGRNVVQHGLTGHGSAGEQVNQRRQSQIEGAAAGNPLDAVGFAGEFFSPFSTGAAGAETVAGTTEATIRGAQEAGRSYGLGSQQQELYQRRSAEGLDPSNPINQRDYQLHNDKSILDPLSRVWSRVKERHGYGKDGTLWDKAKGMVLPYAGIAQGMMDIQDVIKEPAEAGMEALQEYSSLKGKAQPILQERAETAQSQKAALPEQIRELEKIEAAGGLTPGQKQSLEKLRQRQEMSGYELSHEGMGAGERIMEDVHLKRPGVPGVEPIHLPGAGWGLKRFATPAEIWRGEVSFNPFFKRGLDEMGGAPLVGGFPILFEEEPFAIGEAAQNGLESA